MTSPTETSSPSSLGAKLARHVQQLPACIPVDAIDAVFSEVGLPLRFPGGLPNLALLPDIKITDTAPVVRRPQRPLPDQTGLLGRVEEIVHSDRVRGFIP